MPDPYDEIPYRSRAFAATHPAQLATIGTLFGIEPPDPRTARVLEVGCASAGNLTPMAVSLPDATFVGVDLNRGAIELGRRRVAALGVADRVALYDADLAALPDDLGQFDYVIAHGVYSWIGPDHQRALLREFRRRLSPRGVAYVSYNTMPGWAYRSALRHMAVLHANAHEGLPERLGQTRAIVDLIRRATPDSEPHRAVIEAEHRHFSAMPDWYVVHEHLGDHHEAVWFHDMLARIDAADLQFLGEAELRDMVPLDLPQDVQQDVERLGTDQLRMEQYLDFVRNRTFRRTLLCHRDLVIDRDIPLQRARRLHVGAALAPRPSDPREGDAEPEPTPGGNPIGAALYGALADALPSTVSFDDLVAAVGRATRRPADAVFDDVAQQVLGGLAAGTLHAQVVPVRAGRPSARPLASRVARDEIARGDTWVTNLRHQGVQLDPYMAALLPLLDGTRDATALVEDLAPLVASGSPSLLDLQGEPVTTVARARDVLAEGLPRALDVLAYYALLEPPS
jgi:methyltransferase-like protein/SAM-dependent methyltransferase